MKKKHFLIHAVNAGMGCIICALVFISMTGCHKKASPAGTIEYSSVMGIAEGTADFKSADSPKIDIKDIKSYVGQEIDYSSGIDVKNAEDFDDFQMWVDATKVDIYTVGRYTATYQFVFGEKTLEKTIGVTILEREEVSGGLSAENQENASDANSSASNLGLSGGNSAEYAGEAGNSQSSSEISETNQGNASDENNGDISLNQDPPDGNNAGSSNGGSSAGNGSGSSNGGSSAGNDSGSSNVGSSAGNGSGASNGGSSAGGNAGGSSAGNNAGSSSGGNGSGTSNGGSSAGSSTDAPTEHREIITSSQSATKKPSTIGYTNIELLSGKYVKLKCTNARYIVSTRTDESQTIKNDRAYQVSKLVITFNTGEERVLETVEKAIS